MFISGNDENLWVGNGLVTSELVGEGLIGDDFVDEGLVADDLVDEGLVADDVVGKVMVGDGLAAIRQKKKKSVNCVRAIIRSSVELCFFARAFQK